MTSESDNTNISNDEKNIGVLIKYLNLCEQKIKKNDFGSMDNLDKAYNDAKKHQKYVVYKENIIKIKNNLREISDLILNIPFEQYAYNFLKSPHDSLTIIEIEPEVANWNNILYYQEFKNIFEDLSKYIKTL